MVSISLLNFSYCSCIVFLILLLPVFCGSLNFFKRTILNSSSDSSLISISLGTDTGALLVSFNYIVFICFVLLVPVHLRRGSPLPDFIGLCQERESSSSQFSLGFWTG